MRIIFSVVMLIVLMVGAMPTWAQDNTGFETVVYPLVFRDVEKVNGDWLEKPITLSLDNVTDHMTRVSQAGDCIRYTIIAQLISSEFVHIDHVYCPVYYEDWHIDMIEFLTLDGEIFDF